MKLELKHLTPYLPYGLKVQYIHTGGIAEIRSLVDIYEYDDIKIKIGYNDGEHIWMFKPVLRPLSDLAISKLFDNYGDEKLTAIEEFEGNWDLSPLDWVLLEVSKGKQIERLLELNYLVIEELIKHHFDVFDLIGAGLAIDINTI